jgi:thioredoxin 1
MPTGVSHAKWLLLFWKNLHDYEGKLTIFKVDTEKEKELAGIFGIQSIPSLLFVPVEGMPQMAQGALPKETFEQAIKRSSFQ